MEIRAKNIFSFYFLVFNFPVLNLPATNLPASHRLCFLCGHRVSAV